MAFFVFNAKGFTSRWAFLVTAWSQHKKVYVDLDRMGNSFRVKKGRRLLPEEMGVEEEQKQAQNSCLLHLPCDYPSAQLFCGSA